MPADINPITLDMGGEEVTRRIAFQPSFEPVPSFQNLPPLSSSSTTGKETHFAGPSKLSGGEEIPILQENEGKTSSSLLWKLKSVPSLPESYPIDRMAVFVPNASPADVSARISNVLRERSIEAVYDDENAKVQCTTSEGVDFRVRLYRGRDSFAHGIIVEVQRRFGASNVFYHDTIAILDAAEGNSSTSPPLLPTVAVAGAATLPLVDVDDDNLDDNLVDGSSALDMVSMMFSHHGYDAHFLALQTLSSLTDASKMGAATAHAVSSQLTTSDTQDVGAKVMSLVMNKEGEDDTFNLRSMALVVVANVFQALRGEVTSALKEQLRPVLLDELRKADTAPRNALQAARVFEFYVLGNSNCDDNELHNLLVLAHKSGSVRYAALELEAQKCLDVGL